MHNNSSDPFPATFAAPGVHRPSLRSLCGWACLFALIALASNLVDPSTWTRPATNLFLLSGCSVCGGTPTR